MSVSSILSAIAPQFDDDSARSTFIGLAESRVNVCAFGSNSDLAIALMTAHMITMRDLSAKAGGLALGSVSSMKEGDVTLSVFKSKGQSNSHLSTTTFGQQFMSLQDGSVSALSLTGLNGFCGNDC